jgi:4-amino-4-deoxychorismate lyase
VKVLVNGLESDSLPVADRGLHYADGLFETIAVRRGRPRLLDLHLQRLTLGCARLGLPPPDAELIAREVRTVITSQEQVVKLVLTRGAAGRGYRPPERAAPTRVVAGYETPAKPSPHGRVRTCATRLAWSPALAGLKHLGRLEQVLARAEWRDEQIGEGLMLDPEGFVVCGTQSNLFMCRDGGLVTPSVDRAGVDGVMRRVVLRWARERCMVAREDRLRPGDLDGADEVFLTNALLGAWPVRELDGRPVKRGSLATEFNAWLENV